MFQNWIIPPAPAAISDVRWCSVLLSIRQKNNLEMEEHQETFVMSWDIDITL